MIVSNPIRPIKNVADRRDQDPVLARVAVIIPALNEEQSLPHVLADLPDGIGQIIVVDNGSSDATALLAEAAGALVVHEPHRGYGAACLRGLRELRVLELTGSRSPEVIVFLDGDYSDHPELLPTLVEPIFNGQADFVLGSRLSGECEPGAMPPQSRWGNHFACWLMRRLFGAHYTDLGPFRAIAYLSLRQLAMTDRNFGWTVEMQIKAARLGLRIQEIPVPYRRRIGNSKISGTVLGTLKASWKILYVIAKYATRRFPS